MLLEGVGQGSVPLRLHDLKPFNYVKTNDLYQIELLVLDSNIRNRVLSITQTAIDGEPSNLSLGNVEYPFITITQRSTQMRSSIC